MSDLALGLATLATTGAALLVLLIYAPALEAPFLVPKFAALELTASLGVVAFGLQRAVSASPRWRRPVATGAWLVLATTAMAWGAAECRSSGAPYAVSAFARWGAVFGLACGASVLGAARDSGEARFRMIAALTAAAAAVAAMGLLQHVELLPLHIPIISTPGSTFGNRNATAEVMAVALPLGLGALARAPRRGARIALGVALAVELVYLAVTRTRGAWIAAACGTGVTLFWLGRRWSRASRTAAFGALVLAAVAATVPGRFNPRDAGDSKRYSGVVEVLEDGLDAHSTALKTRFGLWRRTLAMVHDHPLVGVGPGNWPVEFPRYAEPGALRDGVLSATLAPRQAHDDLLERTAETGLVGLAALGFLAFALAWAVRDRLRSGDVGERTTSAAAAGALISVVVLGLASFPLEEAGTLALTGLSLGLVAAEDPRAEPVTARRATAVACAGVLLLACAAWRAQRSVTGSWWLGQAERALHRDAGVAGAAVAVDALGHALRAEPDDYRANLRMAQMKLRERQTGEAERAARRAIALEPYGPNAWASLAAAELSAGDFAGARRDASKGLALLHDYPFALDVHEWACRQAGDPAAANADMDRLRVLASGHGTTARAARTLLKMPTD